MKIFRFFYSSRNYSKVRQVIVKFQRCDFFSLSTCFSGFDKKANNLSKFTSIEPVNRCSRAVAKTQKIRFKSESYRSTVNAFNSTKAHKLLTRHNKLHSVEMRAYQFK